MGDVVIGVDAHKRSHTLVAVDEVGRKLGERVAATGEGHSQALEWASCWEPGPVRSGGLPSRHPPARGRSARCRVHGGAVPPPLVAQARRAGWQPSKSDPIDALAVAHAALREPGLPAAQLDGPARKVKLLSDHRRNLMTERTILNSRLRWHLHELDPACRSPPAACAAFASWTSSPPG